MRALTCPEHGPGDGEKLVLEADWPTPELGDNDVLVNVKAAGLNFPDVLQIQGKYQFQPDMPFVVGSEVSGVVEAVGSAVTRYKSGDEVISMGGGFREQAVCNEGIGSEWFTFIMLDPPEDEAHSTAEYANLLPAGHVKQLGPTFCFHKIP